MTLGPAGDLHARRSQWTIDSANAAIVRIIAEEIGVQEEHTLTPETDFFEDLGADSLQPLEVIHELETEFNITISYDEGKDLRTVAEFQAIVHRKLGLTT